MAMFRRGSVSEREKVAKQRCQREAKVIHGRAKQKIDAIKTAEKLATKRLKAACKNNVREIRRTESGKEKGSAARRKATVGRRRTMSKMDQLFHYGNVASSKKAQRTREFYGALYGKRPARTRR